MSWHNEETFFEHALDTLLNEIPAPADHQQKITFPNMPYSEYYDATDYVTKLTKRHLRSFYRAVKSEKNLTFKEKFLLIHSVFNFIVETNEFDNTYIYKWVTHTYIVNIYKHGVKIPCLKNRSPYVQSSAISLVAARHASGATVHNLASHVLHISPIELQQRACEDIKVLVLLYFTSIELKLREIMLGADTLGFGHSAPVYVLPAMVIEDVELNEPNEDHYKLP